MSYATTFDPLAARAARSEATPAGLDLRDGSVYVFSEPLDEDLSVLAVKVALATGRPLLLCGPPGSGKSSLAAFVARTMEWNYFEQVITSRTSAQDLQWSFDAVRRLRDTQAREPKKRIETYLEPQALWWAFNPTSARQRSCPDKLPANFQFAEPTGVLRGIDHPSVVLLDEIDKADLDVPNDLLVVLGSQRFRITETGKEVLAERTPLVIITSNNERALPAAFLRRCVVHVLDQPGQQRLVEIACRHFPKEQERHRALFETIAKIVVERRGAPSPNRRSALSAPEYLDAVRACLELGVEPGASPAWRAIESIVFEKRIA
jgi:MoxR-like ATPase